MNHPTHKQDRHLMRYTKSNSKIFAFFIVATFGLFCDAAQAEWWAPQEGVIASEANPNEEYSASDNTSETTVGTTQDGFNHVPNGPDRRLSFSVPANVVATVQIPINVTDADPTDMLWNQYQFYGDVWFDNWDLESKILTVGADLSFGETAEVVIRVSDRDGTTEQLKSTGFLLIAELEGQ